MPEVSVIIPFYNRVQWLAEAVQSVLNQTYTDFEIILVDDGSVEEIPPHIIEDSRVRYVRQENRGASAARNHGIRLARGNYVAFLDSDDLFLPVKLEKQVAYMDAHRDILLTHTSYQRMSGEGEDREVINSGRFSGRINSEYLFNCGMATPTVMIRRDALDEKMKFEESVQVGQGEDTIFWLTFATKFEIVGIDEPLTKVRIHGNNVMLDQKAQLAAQMNVIKYVVEGNPCLTSAVSRKSLSSIYLTVGYFYYEQRDWTKYLKYLMRAMTTCPLNAEIYQTLARHVVTKLHVGAQARKPKSLT
ncbi:MAG: glycosyltransferase [Acidobacteria bacterium]|nr:glycosyltransferase [Acidobacteriota bacterium]